MTDFLALLAGVYFALAIVKVAFALEALPHVISVYSIRRYGKSWSWAAAAIIAPIALVMPIFYVIPGLFRERLGYFVAYRRFTLTKEVLLALR